MKKYFIAFCFFLISCFSIAQTKDYKSVRDSLTNLSCGKVDTATLRQTKLRLEHFNINSVNENRQLYFYDLGWCYYRLYLKSINTDFLYQAVQAYEKALNISQDYSNCLWNIAFCEYLLCNCEKADKYIDRFKKSTDEKYWKKEQITLMKTQCGG